MSAYTCIRYIPAPPLDAYIDYLCHLDGIVYPREDVTYVITPYTKEAIACRLSLRKDHRTQRLSKQSGVRKVSAPVPLSRLPRAIGSCDKI